MQQNQVKSEQVRKSPDLLSSSQQNKSLNVSPKANNTSNPGTFNSTVKTGLASPSQAQSEQTNTAAQAPADTLRIPESRVSVAIPEIPVKADVFFPEKAMFRKNTDWTFGIIVLALIIIASVRIISSSYLKQLFNATVNFPTASRLFREKTFNLLHASFRLDVLFYVVMSLFVYQILSFFGVSFYPTMPLLTYLICVGGVIGYMVIKRSFLIFISTITESRTEISEYLFNLNVYNRVLGIILFPISLVIAFAPIGNIEVLLIVGAFMVIVFWGMSLLRGSKILLKKHFSIFYLILYLCTLEFLPLLVILKIASE